LITNHNLWIIFSARLLEWQLVKCIFIKNSISNEK